MPFPVMTSLLVSIADSDQSPPRGPSNQMSKTLGGKKAGLQNAKAMKEEMLKLKKKERDTFDKVTSKISRQGNTDLKTS